MDQKTIDKWEKKILKLIETRVNAEGQRIKQFIQIYDTGVISSSYFHQLGLEKSEAIKKALEDNKARAKARKLDEWLHPDANPTLQLAAYKLMATPEEREALSTTAKVDAKVEGNMGIVVAFEDNESGDKD